MVDRLDRMQTIGQHGLRYLIQPYSIHTAMVPVSTIGQHGPFSRTAVVGRQDHRLAWS